VSISYSQGRTQCHNHGHDTNTSIAQQQQHASPTPVSTRCARQVKEQRGTTKRRWWWAQAHTTTPRHTIANTTKSKLATVTHNGTDLSLQQHGDTGRREHNAKAQHGLLERPVAGLGRVATGVDDVGNAAMVLVRRLRVDTGTAQPRASRQVGSSPRRQSRTTCTADDMHSHSTNVSAPRAPHNTQQYTHTHTHTTPHTHTRNKVRGLRGN